MNKTIKIIPGGLKKPTRLCQIQQIGLELKNEKIEQARAEAKEALEHYIDLYDFAPGYFTLDRDGTIQQANLTGSELLGVERSRLVNARFGFFVAENSGATHGRAPTFLAAEPPTNPKAGRGHA